MFTWVDCSINSLVSMLQPVINGWKHILRAILKCQSVAPVFKPKPYVSLMISQWYYFVVTFMNIPVSFNYYLTVFWICFLLFSVQAAHLPVPWHAWYLLMWIFLFKYSYGVMKLDSLLFQGFSTNYHEIKLQAASSVLPLFQSKVLVVCWFKFPPGWQLKH